MSIGNEIYITDQVRPGLIALKSRIGNANREGAQTAGRIVRDLWRKHLSGPRGPHSLGVVTGKRRASIKYRTGRIPGGWQATVAPDNVRDSRILKIHEFGGQTPPHVIRPRRASVLSWVGPGGVRRFAKQVNHPGSLMPRRPHRAPALKDARGPLGLVFRGKYERALAEARRIGLAHPTRLTMQQARAGGFTNFPGSAAGREFAQFSPEATSASAELAALLGQGE